MKLERIKRRSGGTLVLEITPLIDVVFLCLFSLCWQQVLMKDQPLK